MNMANKWIPLFVLFALSLFVYRALGYFTNRADFLQLILLFSSAFVLYALWYQQASKHNFTNESVVAAMLLRVALLFYLPNLSDDFYRFVWDGRLSAQGINPFSYLPSELMHSSVANVDAALFEKLNSKEFYSVYPPLNQFVFCLSALISPSDLLGSVIILKLFIVCCELGTFFLARKLLRQFHLNENLILLYALNPLVIVELTGNIHFEAAMIIFIVLSVYLMVRGKFLFSSVALSIAICTKFWPVLFIPFFYKRFFRSDDKKDRLKGVIRYTLWIISIFIFTTLLFLPFWMPDMLAKIGSSVNLYFQYFEFNGSIFYLIRWIGLHVKGYDVIRTVGPWLPVMVTLVVLFYFLYEQKPQLHSLFLPLLFSLTVFLLFATTVHPWYITPLILFCIFTPLRFPLVWSALIPLSYIAYSFTPVNENEWLIILEYFVVEIFAIVELKMLKSKLTLGSSKSSTTDTIFFRRGMG